MSTKQFDAPVSQAWRGPEGIVKAMRKLLVDLKASEDNIRTEEFTGY